jgi:phosphonate transport system substrate-binding protein
VQAAGFPHPHRAGALRIGRRGLFAAGAGFALAARRASAQAPVEVGITPVVVDSDIVFLADFASYLSGRLGTEVVFQQRRTYREITTLLLSGQIAAAWICGFPFVQNRGRLELVAVPLYREAPLYQSYLLVRPGDPAASLADLRGQIHAFSDPDSNSGYLVTRWMLHEMGEAPAGFFRSTFFTYGHRNVVRAVAAGLAQSGSVDGYVWDTLADMEPDLTAGTRILHRSQRLGFPPIACLAARAADPMVIALRQALLDMAADPAGRPLLATLRLDGFSEEPPALFDGIADLWETVKDAP